MHSSLLVAVSLALIAGAGAGCLGDGDERAPGTATPSMRSTRGAPPDFVAFRARAARNVRYALVAGSANGGLVRVLTGGTERDRPRPALFERAAWSPDGRQLAFTAEVGRELATPLTDIYVMRADGSDRRRLTTDGRSFHPLWSPDGRRILFARRPTASRTETDARLRVSASIWSMRFDGSGARRVTRLAPRRTDLPGSFSPDGSLVALTRTIYRGLDRQGRKADLEEVWVMRPDGSHARPLTDRSVDPAFSPDGRLIAFASARDEHGELSYGDRSFFANELYVMRADGSRARRITHTRDLNERRPSWLPGGAQIAYQRGEVIDNAEGTVVMHVNADGTCPQPILADPRLRAWHAAPSWRPRPARAADRARQC